LICFLGYNPPKNTPFDLASRNGEERKKIGEKWSPSYFLLLQRRTWAVFKKGEGNIALYKITKIPLLMRLVPSSSIYRF